MATIDSKDTAPSPLPQAEKAQTLAPTAMPFPGEEMTPQSSPLPPAMK